MPPESVDPAPPTPRPGAGPPGPMSGSNDELSVLLNDAGTKPDPLLGSFASHTGDAPELAPAPEPYPSEARTRIDIDVDLTAPSLDSRGSFDGLDAPPEPRPGKVPQPASFDAFPSIDLTAPPPASSAPAPSRAAPSKPAPPPVEEDEEDDDALDVAEARAARRQSILTMLLLSYASAVTIGLAWVLLSGRRLREADEAEPSADASADPGRRAGQSRKVAPAPPLAADHTVALGATIKLGSLEITPLGVASGPVTLRRQFNDDERKDGGRDALTLTLRLRNVSADALFAPLDEAFVRERERGVHDSVIEAGDGRQVDMYPLAVASEWTLAGQDFRPLKPGEAWDARVISAPEAFEGGRPPKLTWRVRLRTGIDRTDTIGVPFQADAIKAGR